LMKRTIASSALVLYPRTGHACNLEEPELFNKSLHDFFTGVDQGRWGMRDPRSTISGITGMK
ncbi:MAG: alpha/beta fold hydrolase, partial [Alphaproteobacteria bacterium]